MADPTAPERTREEIRAAKQVANEALRHSATADWWAERDFMRQARGGDLTISELHEKTGTVTQRGFLVAVQVLIDEAKHNPSGSIRTKAARHLSNLHMKEMELKLRFLQEYRVVEGGFDAVPPTAAEEAKELPDELDAEVVPALPTLSRDEMTELIQMRRRTARIPKEP